MKFDLFFFKSWRITKESRERGLESLLSKRIRFFIAFYEGMAGNPRESFICRTLLEKHSKIF